MADTSYDYEIKRGDTLSEIAVWYKNRIAGSTNKAKVKTLCKVNNIKNANKIYVGQKIKFSASGSTADTTPPQNRKVENLVVALQAGDKTGRELYAVWTWSRINTKGFKLRWSQHLNGVWQASDSSFDIPEGTPRDKYVEYNNAEFTADKEAKKVRLQVLPVATEDSKGKPYWEENGKADKDVAWATVEYDFANNPPLVPSAPSVEMHKTNDKKIVIKIDNIKADELDAKYVQFNIVKNNTTSVLGASSNVTINTAGQSVEYEYNVEYGATYKARARCVGANGKTSTWSDFSSEVSTKPCAPKAIKSIYGDKRDDGLGNKAYAVQLEWEKVTNAQYYVIEYTTDLLQFEQNTSPENVNTTDAKTSFCVTGIEKAGLYYFRVRAATSDGVSDPSPHVSITLGEPPLAPTIWSTADSVFEGETMDLNWTHNPRDGSKQSLAQIAIKIGDRDWVDTGNTFENTTTEDDRDPVSAPFQNPYPAEIPGAASSIGSVISYKGSLYFKMDTSHPILVDEKIQWKVRTAGITSGFSSDPADWSPPKTIYVYSKPRLGLSVMSNLENNTPLEDILFAHVEVASEELEYTDESALPFAVQAVVDLPTHDLVGDIRYHVLVVSEDYFEVADETGTLRAIDIGDEVYSGVFDTTGVLQVEIPADQITLKKGLRYSIQCSAEMQIVPLPDCDPMSEPYMILSATNSSSEPLFEDIECTFDVNTITNALTQFPLYIRANAQLDSYEIQRPIGYQVRITAGEYYETVDDTGRAKIVNIGDEVYSKYFNTGNEFLIELQANHVDLEPGVPYTIHCSADMSTGLTITETYDFNVYWKDVEYTIGADVTIDRAAYTADIMPYCMDANGIYLDNIRLSVYRREYNGTFTEIATDVPNGGTAVTDPHPSLDYARYRISATDMTTGAVTFYDLPGHKVGCSGIVIQWDEEWSAFDASTGNSAEPPEWTGSMLVFPYNVSVSDDRAREVATVAYAGREYPVVYYGTRLSESTQWSAVIPKDDTDTIYALRRLSIWSGPSYVREPSGMGFWAHVSPKFSISHDGVTIQVNFDITRVEGGA